MNSLHMAFLPFNNRVLVCSDHIPLQCIIHSKTYYRKLSWKTQFKRIETLNNCWEYFILRNFDFISKNTKLFDIYTIAKNLRKRNQKKKTRKMNCRFFFSCVQLVCYQFVPFLISSHYKIMSEIDFFFSFLQRVITYPLQAVYGWIYNRFEIAKKCFLSKATGNVSDALALTLFFFA